jgi:molybdenum cofactor biosynthesis protein B
MSHLEHKKVSPATISYALIVISDSRTEQDDESGKLFKEKLAEHGHKLISYSLIKNDAESVRHRITELLKQDDVQVIITSGGTGLSHRDITVETVTPMLEKKMDGFGELFRSLSYVEIGVSSLLSRAVAGVANGKVILSLPGSLGATRLALEKIIIPEIGHMVREAAR